jgi:very-short-patch-repair endonuclease
VGFAQKRSAWRISVQTPGPVLDYFLDFYCGEAMVCVEVDGELHALRTDRDEVRDRRLAEAGILTIRVPSLDLFDDHHPELVDKWLQHIEATCWWRAHQ